MTATEQTERAARLDAACGGPPTHTEACQEPRCTRVVGPYYDARQAREALAEHVRMRHSAVWQAGRWLE